MYCMKCGREIGEDQVFCDSCLSVMKKYPVKPGTRVQLPNRTPSTVSKKAAPKKKSLSPEERLAGMRKAIQWLSVALAVSVLALALSVALLFDAVAPKDTESSLGQNYSTAEHTENTP